MAISLRNLAPFRFTCGTSLLNVCEQYFNHACLAELGKKYLTPIAPLSHMTSLTEVSQTRDPIVTLQSEADSTRK